MIEDRDTPTDLTYVIEGLLFASGRILTAAEISRAYEKVTRALLPSEGEINEAVDRLNLRLEESGSALHVHRWGGGFRLATEPAVTPFINAVFEAPPRRLTKSLMETQGRRRRTNCLLAAGACTVFSLRTVAWPRNPLPLVSSLLSGPRPLVSAGPPEGSRPVASLRRHLMPARARA